MKRPRHLPDFASPPLDEVVLGIQMSPFPDYLSVDAGDVWKLFHKEYPRVEEQAPLISNFEVFGGRPPLSPPSFKLELAEFGTPPRLWFVSENENDILQFQPDRFLLNWRKQQGDAPYPRFEHIAANFERHLNALAMYLKIEKRSDLEINQVEISYINVIPIESFSQFGQWFTLWNTPIFEIEGMRMAFPVVVFDQTGEPMARMHHEIVSALNVATGQRVIKFTLTFRGQPKGRDIASTMDFLAKGREQIVKRFAEVTTPEAHEAWKRSKWVLVLLTLQLFRTG